MSANLVCTRREVVRRAAALVALPLALPPARPQEGQAPPVGRLSDPSVAGKPRWRVTDYQNDPFVVGVEERLRCTCGCNLSVYTCRTTDFTCDTSPAMHRQVIALVEEGKTAEEILGAFVAQYGEMVLMAPPKRGFNLAGYLVPGVAIAVAGAFLVRRLVRGPGSGVRDPGVAGPPPDPDRAASPDPRPLIPDPDRAKLAAEFEKLDL